MKAVWCRWHDGHLFSCNKLINYISDRLLILVEIQIGHRKFLRCKTIKRVK